MFRALQKKWGVSGLRFFLIFCVFGVGGSLTGWLGRKIMPLLSVENDVLYWVLYVVIVTIIWPFCVLLVSIPFGQLAFFQIYLRKLSRRISGHKRS